ncbi:hypothetical protein EIN_430730 [Entamoeba invadens IP1]|uniref:Uncharacterized protein n=1 Tax=Entamoeba invadens IP1 TaxID=370355 RepID=A0A0A1UHG2_ENTIV|nr:hypothetical protein EIN_430730 [Entamoeba invadens IP1]ELP95267.1 hypothetical protein EIN_430730 [Entamoeba invadens IP1]|eukprot:XP_004262038.1 hypothetical protein EIN_430730 [Entamoeba invadens IP1]
MSSKTSHNLIKNDTVGRCEWTKNEQQTLDEELFKMQQTGQQFDGITSILKISGRFPTKSIQQITSRIKWCQFPPNSRPVWDEYCQNEAFYLQRAEQQTQQPCYSPRTKDVCLPSTTRSEASGYRRRRYSVQEEGGTESQFRPNEFQQTTYSQPLQNVKSSIMIGTNNSRSPRVYRPHSPVTFSVMQNTMANQQSNLHKLVEDNEIILTELERQANSPTATVDTAAILRFIENANAMIVQSKIFVQNTLPFFAKKLEIPSELTSNIFPFIQSDSGLQFIAESKASGASGRGLKAMSLPGRGPSAMSTSNGSFQGI